MSTPISSLRNLGPAMELAFARAGITSAEELHEIGVDTAYARLLKSGVRAHFSAFWSLSLALQDRHWEETTPEEKAALRKRYEAIRTRAKPAPMTERERALDALGVIPRR